LTTDKTARQALKNKDFQKALQEPAVRAALASSDVRYAIGSVRLGVAGDAAALAKSDLLFRAALDANAALKVAFDASPALRAALASQDVIAAMNSAALAAVLSQPDVVNRLSNDVVMQAVLSAPDVVNGAAAGAAGGAANDVIAR
jgi:hypothetical protein